MIMQQKMMADDFAQIRTAVSGAQDTAVTFTSDGGTITSGGVFTASEPGTYNITATSVEDPTKSTTTQVTVVAPPVKSGDVTVKAQVYVPPANPVLSAPPIMSPPLDPSGNWTSGMSQWLVALYNRVGGANGSLVQTMNGRSGVVSPESADYSNVYLGLHATADDSAKLGGIAAGSYVTNDYLLGLGYQTATQVSTYVTSLGYQTAAQVATYVTSQGYLTTINGSMIVTALGFTPMNAAATVFNGLNITASLGTLTIPNNAAAKLITSGSFAITLVAAAASTVNMPQSTSATMIYNTANPATANLVMYSGGANGAAAYLAAPTVISAVVQTNNAAPPVFMPILGGLASLASMTDETAWTPVATGLAVVPGTGAATWSGFWSRVGNIVMITAQCIITGTATIQSGYPATTITLPTNCKNFGGLAQFFSYSSSTWTTMDLGFNMFSNGVLYIPTFAAMNQNLYISGWYFV